LKKKNISNLRELVYQINNRNSYVLAKEFDFDEFEEDYIRHTFWPIITLNEIDVDSIIAKTLNFKEEFINYYKEFDIDIFKREHLDFFENEIKEFLSVIKKGKYNLWDTKKGKHFYHLKLESEKDTPRHQTLLITEKDEIQLELYFKKIIVFIEKFTEDTAVIYPKNTNQKTEESIKSERLIIDVQQENKTHFSELTLNNFMELISDLDAIVNRDFNCQYHSLSEIEVDEYLERKSNNYSLDKLQKMLFDSDVFDNMVLDEETSSICTEEYINRELEIPTYEVETILGKDNFYNYKEMRNKIMPFSSSLFHYFRSQMDKKINEIKLNNEKQTESKVLNTRNQLKNKIAHELIGDNKTSNNSIEYHHIAEILNKYSISQIEARQILLDMQGTFSPSTNEIIVEPIIKYFERSSFNQKLSSKNNDNEKEIENSTEIILEKIWLSTAKISVQQFLKKGFELGIWDEDYNLTQQRGAKLFGSGKVLLGSLAGALKNYTIMESIHYKIIGKVFCKAFNIEIKKETKDSYKSFSNYNEKYKKAFIRSFNIKF
jgi:hypothetical protein